MPKYAHFNSRSSLPQPVLGWYDTDEFQYKNLPDQADLLALNVEEWKQHFWAPNGYQVVGGKLEKSQDTNVSTIIAARQMFPG